MSVLLSEEFPAVHSLFTQFIQFQTLYYNNSSNFKCMRSKYLCNGGVCLYIGSAWGFQPELCVGIYADRVRETVATQTMYSLNKQDRLLMGKEADASYACWNPDPSPRLLSNNLYYVSFSCLLMNESAPYPLAIFRNPECKILNIG